MSLECPGRPPACLALHQSMQAKMSARRRMKRITPKAKISREGDRHSRFSVSSKSTCFRIQYVSCVFPPKFYKQRQNFCLKRIFLDL